MSVSASQKTIDELLKNWMDAKEEEKNLRLELERYRRKAEKIMSKKKSNTLRSKKFKLKVQRRDNTRMSLGPADVPEDVCDEYCNQITYSTFHVSKDE